MKRLFFSKKWIFLVVIIIIIAIWLGNLHHQLQVNKQGPVDAILVLGGSIQREVYGAKLALVNPEIPILISQGSPEPCVLLIFSSLDAPIERVWLEKCALSTFDNFYYAPAILKRWRTRKVTVITSASHLPRAQLLGQIILSSQGIWMDLVTVEEPGIPGNKEYWWKTSFDVLRATGWSIIGQFITPECPTVIRLSDVNLSSWEKTGFKCENYRFLNPN